MSYRQIHVKIWKDSWFIRLNPEERLHFIYLFSNEAASVSGIYELPMRVQAFETGLSLDIIESNLIEFEAQGKVSWDGEHSVVWVKMLRRYNANPSPKIEARIIKDLKAIPNCSLKKEYCSHYGIDYDTLSMGYRYPIDTVSKINKKKNKTRTGNKQEQEQQQQQDPIDRVSIGYHGNNGSGGGLIFELYEDEIGKPSKTIRPLLADAAARYPEEWITEAFQIAAVNNVKKWAYIQAILKRWDKRGKITAGKEDYLDDEFAEFIEE